MIPDPRLSSVQSWDQIILGQPGWRLIEHDGRLLRGPSCGSPMQIWEPDYSHWRTYWGPVELPEGWGRDITALEARQRYGPSLHLQPVSDFGTPYVLAPEPPLTLEEIEERIISEVEPQALLWPGTASASRRKGRR